MVETSDPGKATQPQSPGDGDDLDYESLIRMSCSVSVASD